MTYEKMTVKELKKYCKDNYIKNYSKLKKEELIKLIKKKDNEYEKRNNDFIKFLEQERIKEQDKKKLLLKNLAESDILKREEDKQELKEFIKRKDLAHILTIKQERQYIYYMYNFYDGNNNDKLTTAENSVVVKY